MPLENFSSSLWITSRKQPVTDRIIPQLLFFFLIVDHQEEEIQSIEYEVDALTKLLDQIESGLLKAQALIDKKQNLIDMKTKEREELILAKNGAALSPLEADIGICAKICI